MKFLVKQFTLSILLLALHSNNALASFSLGKDGQILFENKSWKGEIDLSTLSIKANNKIGKKALLADCPIDLGEIKNLTYSLHEANWYYPERDLKVNLSLQDNQLILRFDTTKEQELLYPRTGQAKEMKAIIYPSSEGVIYSAK